MKTGYLMLLLNRCKGELAMMRGIQQSLRNLSLKRKIYAILCIALIPLTLAALIGVRIVMNSYTALLYRNIAGQLSYSGQIISDQLENIDTLSSMIYSHDKVQKDMLLLKYSDDYMERSSANMELRALLLEYYENFRSNHVSYIDLFSGSFSTSGNAYASRQVPDEVHDDVRRAAQEADGAVAWISTYSSQYGLFLGREVRRIQFLSHDELGEEVIGIDISGMIAEATRFSGQFEDASYLLLDSNEIVFHSPSLSDEDATQIQSELTEDYRVISLNDHSYFAVRGRIDHYNWDYICLVSYDGIVETTRQTQTAFFVILALAILAIVFIASKVIDPLTRHFKVLVSKMDSVGKGQGSVTEIAYDYSTRKDEAGILHQQFDQMTERLQNLIQTNYVNELLRKDAQLKAMENQINPHFLYNTLESVNWRAQALGAEDISMMVRSLGAMLRVTLSRQDEPFTVRREIELVRSYLSIQNFRFEDRLTFSIDVPEELMVAQIPKLTLQPLVENAIHYGLEENTDECTISVTARREGSILYISVSNTGSLFDEDLLEKLRSGQITPHGHGIGLLNIDQRIKLTFGEEYGLNLFNHEESAVAMVRIPMCEEDVLC